VTRGGASAKGTNGEKHEDFGHYLRRSAIDRSFMMTFEMEETVVAFAPGRVELLGNHTDYNEGLALA
jgi:Galactokinase galactose-binding signature